MRRSGFKNRPGRGGTAAKKAIRRVERVAADATAAGRRLTSWEETFLRDLQARLDRYGRAFADPEKGNPSVPFSVLQDQKLRQIQKAGISGTRREAFGLSRRKRQIRDGSSTDGDDQR